MPIRYWILEDENLTYAQWTGVITLAEMRANFENYLADPLYQQGRPELIDLMGVTSIDVGIKTMVPLLGLVNAAEFKSNAKTKTIIVTKRKYIFGIARMYQLLASTEDGIKVQVFDNEAEALSALNRRETSIADLFGTLPGPAAE